jgi:hypothetical protein
VDLIILSRKKESKKRKGERTLLKRERERERETEDVKEGD